MALATVGAAVCETAIPEAKVRKGVVGAAGRALVNEQSDPEKICHAWTPWSCETDEENGLVEK